MGLPQLDNLVRIRQLKSERPAQSELDGLIRTVRLAPEQWRVLDQAHRKRNIAGYEGHLDVDQGLVKALLRVTEEVALRVKSLGHLPGGENAAV